MTLADIAKSAQVSLVDLRRDFGSKAEILAAFVRAVDDEVLARAPAARREPAAARRDLRGGDAPLRRARPLQTRLEVHLRDRGRRKPPLCARSPSRRPGCCARPALPPKASTGSCAPVGLAAVYASVFRTWLDDDDPGLARTMAALDRRLRRGERTLNTLEEIRSRLCGLAWVVHRRPQARVGHQAEARAGCPTRVRLAGPTRHPGPGAHYSPCASADSGIPLRSWHGSRFADSSS